MIKVHLVANSKVRNKLSWSDEKIPEIEVHTKAKHKIIETYLENFIYTLYGKGRRGITSFTIVDGFCGGGEYRDSETGLWKGSPIRIIKAVRRGHLRASRNYDLDVKYLFIDESAKHINH